MSRRNWRDRQRRTLLAPNGARVVFPPGTSSTVLFGHMLRWVYEPMVADLVKATPLLDAFKEPLPREVTIAPAYGIGPLATVMQAGTGYGPPDGAYIPVGKADA